MAAFAIPTFPPEEYLRLERAAEYKSEYIDGQILAMSGGTFPHALVGTNLVLTLGPALRGRGCGVVNSDLRTAVTPQGPFFYPDAVIYCGEPLLSDHHRDALLNPVVVFEVLSESTEGYDRGLKFRHYRRIPTLREYVLISQTMPHIDVFTKGTDAKWTLTEFDGLDAVCELTALSVRFPLAEIYEGVPLKTERPVGTPSTAA
jgi:Uma2 family endonuclease